MIDLTTLFLIALATYRLTLLFSKEAGPWDMFGKFRTLLGVKYDAYSNPYATNPISEMILCPFCTSVWIGIVITIGWVAAQLLGIEKIYLTVLLPFALSGFAVFLFRWVGT